MMGRARALAYAGGLGWSVMVHATTLDEVTPAPVLDDLLGDMNATPAPAGSVRLDAWVEGREEGARRELVVVIEPEGKTKLVADPGITLIPDAAAYGVEWQVPLPHRVVDSSVDYWEGQRAVRIPFEAAEGTPLDFTIEYAWCVLDFQCFFGEETLSVANRVN